MRVILRCFSFEEIISWRHLAGLPARALPRFRDAGRVRLDIFSSLLDDLLDIHICGELHQYARDEVRTGARRN